MKNHWYNNIEDLVRERKTLAAITAIKKAGRACKDLESRLLIAEAYRRLGFTQRALASLKVRSKSPEKMTTEQIWEQITACRYINLLGGSDFALGILAQVTLERIPTELSDVAANIYLSNGRYSEALHLFDRSLSVVSDPFKKSILLIGRADALRGLNKISEAKKIAQKLSSAKFRLVRFMALSALGEYCLSDSDSKAAYFYLKQAEHFKEDRDRSPDIAIWKKWMGVASLCEGKKKEGASFLDDAFCQLKQPGYKPEGWLEVAFWKGYFEFKESEELPELWKRLLVYPSQNFSRSYEMGKAFGVQHLGISGSKISTFSDSNSFYKNSQGTIDFTSKLIVNEKKRVSLGIPLKEQCLGILIRGGAWGVPVFRLFDALWDNEIYSFSSLEKRLENLIFELRSEGHKIEWKNRELKIQRTPWQAIWGRGEGTIGECFLKECGTKPFSRVDLENYFRIERTKATDVLKCWKDEGLVINDPKSRWKFTKTKNLMDQK